MSYSTGKIYKIVSKLTDKIYIGSTRQTLEDRFRRHKCEYTAYLKSNIGSTTSIELLKYEDCEIVLIELFTCESKTELKRREGEIQLANIGIIVNQRIAGRTVEESSAQYRLDNKEKIAAPFKCECGSIVWYNNKSRHNKSKKHILFISA